MPRPLPEGFFTPDEAKTHTCCLRHQIELADRARPCIADVCPYWDWQASFETLGKKTVIGRRGECCGRGQ